MNEQDYKLLKRRRSCALLTRSEMLQGKVPTTPTTSSIIAGIQVQEAVKLIHGRDDLPTLAGKGFFYNGLTHDSYIVDYNRKDGCLSHETFTEIVELPGGYNTRIGDLLERVRQDLGLEAVLDLDKEIVTHLQCERCHAQEPVFKLLGQVTEQDARCPLCGEIRIPEMTHTITGREPFLDDTFKNIGLPPFDIVTGRVGLAMRHYEFSGDLENVMR